ncbi:MAG: hypothetical protein DME19_12070 [Verrucomicrobia bacterium]|nr:MAG: hypothetical protein DME19_12070 [Verrucomicrobiota bacterium]
MNALSKPGLFLTGAFCSSFSLLALTVNDGSATTNLVQITNADSGSQGDAVVSLEVVTNSVLKAYQTGTSGDFAFRSAWYASDLVPTSGVYTATSDFLPGDDASQCRGGVMGWFNTGSSNAIVLQVVPENPVFLTTTFKVSVVDFTAANSSDNEGFSHLFNLDGTAASEDIGSASSAGGASYSVTNFATLQLAFSAPTAADANALSNATAHITAKVFQGTNANNTPIQLGSTLELLTDLPLPAADSHRLGYFAVWGSVFLPGDVIGYLDNLTGQGGVGLPPNALPTVSITGPTNGATFTEPATIALQAIAADGDGTVARVDFFAGTNLLGTATNSPFGFTWANVVAGNYSLTAQATDDRGGTSTSNPVNITVNASTGGGPRLTLVRTGNTLEISWTGTGYQLQMKTNLSSLNWTDVATNTVNLTNVTLQMTSDTVFFRLIQVGAPGGPKLALQLSGTSVVVSWPALVTGYRLQSNTDLSTTNWTDVASQNNQATEVASAPAKFYRLIKP